MMCKFEELPKPKDQPFNIELKPSQIRLMAKFFQEVRLEGCEDLNNLFKLQDLWDKTYNEHRIKGFSNAQYIANVRVINAILLNEI